MKIIYDSEQPKDKRIEFVGISGKSYFGFHCFQIKLDDGKEVAEIGLWGDVKKRQSILEQFNNKEKEGNNGKTKTNRKKN